MLTILLLVAGSGVSPYGIWNKCWSSSFSNLPMEPLPPKPHHHHQWQWADYISTVCRVVLNMSPKINFSSLVNLFKTPYAVQGQSPVEHGFQNGENKSETYSISRTIRKKPNERSKADRWPSPDDFMTGQRELGTTSRTVGPESCRLSTFKPLVISAYNVRTLHQQGKSHQLFMVVLT